MPELRISTAKVEEFIEVAREVAGKIIATPAYPGVRLWDDSMSALMSTVQKARRMREKVIRSSYRTRSDRWL